MARSGFQRPPIVGRETELATVIEFLTASDEGFGALVLGGEAGIGKTTVWLQGLAAAQDRGYRVISTRTAPSEAAFSFAGLGDLAEDVLDGVAETLPPPQREALDVALLRAPTTARSPQSRSVAVAVLSLLRALASTKPLVVAIDDMQWLDRASFAVLEFATRRLRTETIRLFATMRSGDGADTDLTKALEPRRVRRVSIGPLSVGALHHVVMSELGRSVSRPLLLQIHETSGGNPFFAVEMARGLSKTAVADQRGRQLRVPESLSVLVRDRLASLSPQVRQVLLHVAAMARPDRSVLEKALPARFRTQESLRDAAEADVVAFDGDRVRFSHPLLGSVLYTDAPSLERRRVHRQLATAVRDPEERALHLALATAETDAGVAAVLEDAALQARARGATSAAASLSREAVRLTPPGYDDDEWRRSVQTAEYLFLSGEGDEARRLLQDLAAAMPSGARRGEVLWRLGRMRHEGYDFRNEHIELFDQALAELPPDHDLRALILNALAWAELHDDYQKAAKHAAEAVRAAETAGDLGNLADGLASVAFFACMRGSLEEEQNAFERALALESHIEGLYIDERPSWLRAVSLMFHDEFDESRTRIRSLIGQALERGEENSLPSLRFRLGLLESWAGNWALAEQEGILGYEGAVQTGQLVAAARLLHGRALVHALLGQHELARDEAQKSLRQLEATGQPLSVRGAARCVLGFIALSEGDAAGALEELVPANEAFRRRGVGEPGAYRVTGDLAEAYVSSGDLDAADAVIAELEGQGRRLNRAYALATGARCRALLYSSRGDLEAATGSVNEALQHHERLPQPFELGRTLLVVGQVQRRRRLKRESRASLNRALEIFQGLGASMWAQKTREEIARIGGRTASGPELTDTERKVAELVAGGHSNKEVAAALFVSAKTVEASLTRIYGKLGVRSRTELARHLHDQQG
jgi:DNA-binding CsgD family transcriptional regulator